ncbi:MAG: RNA pseudouridine synthase, partial [Pseudomonadota bacterium]
LREGKNREIRRAMAEIGLDVNRLIRISYGPFQLKALKPGEVEEVRPRILRDQLGLQTAVEGHAKARDPGTSLRKKRPSGAKSGPKGAPKATSKTSSTVRGVRPSRSPRPHRP